VLFSALLSYLDYRSLLIGVFSCVCYPWQIKIHSFIHSFTCVCVSVVDALRDALAQVKELSRQIPELHAVKLQLETERDGLKAEVSDLQDALRDALARLDTANNTVTQLRADLERRLREKDEEIDGIRSVQDPLYLLTATLLLLFSLSADCSARANFSTEYFALVGTISRHGAQKVKHSNQE